ncbi:MFS transporter [Streptomyces sp. NPDC001255]|uniref:MFS transporter n=1 Tax=Streptomyces sp. NPDC001255 TaxID=3364550 RepID=UPI0036BA2AF1
MRVRLPGWARVAAGITVVGWGANQFAALLPVYREALGLPNSFIALAFATYVVGLVPALFAAAEVADRFDRRWPVRIAVALAAVASVVLCLGSHEDWLLLLGRLLSGAAAGAVLGPGTAWVTDLSGDSRPAAPRRVAVALSVGFGGGPLVAGLVAQWAPRPEVVPYALHLILSVAGAALLWRVPDASPDQEERTEQAERAVAARPSSASETGQPQSFRGAITSRPFLWAIPATAPWVFGAATMSFAVVPSVIRVPGFDAATAGIVTGITMGAGALVQPLAQRVELAKKGAALPVGLAFASLGMLFAALALAARSTILMLPTAIALGAAYGVVLVAGLRRTEDLGVPKDRARLNAVFYSFTYVGFAQPLVFTVVTTTPTSQTLYAVLGAIVAAATAFCTAIETRKSGF